MGNTKAGRITSRALLAGSGGLVLCTLILATGCSDPAVPSDVAKVSNVRLSDGFRVRGGAIITEEHVLTLLDLVENVETPTLTTPEGKKSKSKVIGRGEKVQGALLYMQDHKEEKHAKVGQSALLPEGAELTASLFGKSGKAELHTGKHLGWRYHEGRAYLQTDIPTAEEDLGAGVYGPDGTLIGLVALRRGSKLTFVSPVEYYSEGAKALTAHQFTKHAVGEREVSPEFAKLRDEGAKHPEALADTIDFDSFDINQVFSKTALVGEATMLQKADAPVAGQKVTYTMKASDSLRNETVLAEGAVAADNLQWHPDEEKKKAKSKELAEAYGDTYVKENLDPYEYGTLRYRIPFAPFCPKVTNKEVHNLTLSLADGRSIGPIGFQDLVFICAGEEENEGDALEQAWGMSGGGSKGKAKGKRKGKGRRKRK